ncbi:hypothetical protein Closa_0590 [[Clostridium] saccharolyticum WM1]|uniref:Uncharacterized protein n=1 Tax=Lacrimispora saccharolytica (strain ATCC 35040 / DSM 2544 / NRCC 2533 / WM1) TaxID=610130 RepID=D9R4N4_LACSW|nr:hypothetical protein Closa_0590 [[Clostridium] saccharolyticum WM1]
MDLFIRFNYFVTDQSGFFDTLGFIKPDETNTDAVGFIRLYMLKKVLDKHGNDRYCNIELVCANYTLWPVDSFLPLVCKLWDT